MNLEIGCGLDAGQSDVSIDNGFDWGHDTQRMIEELRAEGCDLSMFIVADVENLPFKDGTFDKIHSCRFIGRGFPIFWEELARVLIDTGSIEFLSGDDEDLFAPELLARMLEYFPKFTMEYNYLPPLEEVKEGEPISFEGTLYKRR